MSATSTRGTAAQAAQQDVAPPGIPTADRRRPSPGRFTRLRRYLRGLDAIGLVLALLAALSSLTPSLLPRSWWAQGLVTGLGAAGAYAVGVVVTRVLRWAGVPSPSRRAGRAIRRLLTVFAVVALAVMAWLSSAWQNDVRRAVGMPPQGRYLYLGVFLVTVAVFTGLIGLARLIADLYRWLVGRLQRVIPPVAARLTAAVVVVALGVTLLNGALYHGLVGLAQNISSSADHRTDAGALQPRSALRSGGPASLVSWSSLGREGRDFVSTGPSAGAISRLTGRPALTPIRVYAGLAAASSLRGEAGLVLAELERTGAFDRPVVAIATTTGTGWVDAALADPLEYEFDGNTAIAAMQYSYLPSWASFIVDKSRSREAGRVLFDVVYDHWATLPPDHRPRLVVFGESLGSFGGSAAFSGLADLTNRAAGALFVGPPNSTDLWRGLTDQRRTGSPERLPVYGNGQTVRFAATAADLRNPDGSLSSPRLVFVQHASDPVVWWSPSLIGAKPAWLRESRGRDVVPQMRWFPGVTFWQTACDMIVAQTPPGGHGHHYGPEIPAAWAAILHPPGWTDAQTAKLASSSG